jgi:hypothetical protein
MKPMTRWLSLWMLTGCGSTIPCEGLFYNLINMHQVAPMVADLPVEPYLYGTITRLDLPLEFVRDRVQLVEAEGGWGFASYWGNASFTAPPNRCKDPGLFYPYRIKFELGAADQSPIDPRTFPPLDFDVKEDPREPFVAHLWAGFQLQGTVQIVPHNGANLPVDTGE